NPAPGTSSGQAIDAMERLVAEALPQAMRAQWTELALLQLETGNTAMFAFTLAVVLVFLVLAAQYESWSLPLAVILVVPMCLLCSTIGVNIARMDINIFGIFLTPVFYYVIQWFSDRRAEARRREAEADEERPESPHGDGQPTDELAFRANGEPVKASGHDIGAAHPHTTTHAGH